MMKVIKFYLSTQIQIQTILLNIISKLVFNVISFYQQSEFPYECCS